MVDSPPDDPVRHLVRSKIAENELDMAALSRQIGKNQTYVQQYLTRGSPKWLPEDVRATLARLLGVEERLLKRPQEPEFARGRAIQGSPLFRAMSATAPATGPEKVPVMGTGAAGADGEAEWNGEIVEYVARPEALQGVPGAYAAYVHGDSVAPRYRHGELVYMHPSRPVSPGCYVFVQIGEPEEGAGPTKRALIKEYVRRTANKLILAQHNPPKRIEIELPRVKQIHRIVQGGEP